MSLSARINASPLLLVLSLRINILLSVELEVRVLMLCSNLKLHSTSSETVTKKKSVMFTQYAIVKTIKSKRVKMHSELRSHFTFMALFTQMLVLSYSLI